jgi:hypothetical protein
MMMYRIAMFFAIIGALAGAMGGIMDYEVAHGGSSWFPGADMHKINNSTIFSQEQIESMQAQGSVSSTYSTSSSSYDFSIISLMGVVWSMGTGIVCIEPQLEKVFVVNDPYAITGTSTNLFSPFLWCIQIGIWCIYAIGVTQVWRNQNYRYNL